MTLASIKDLAQETFRELRKKKNIENAYKTFTKEMQKLYDKEVIDKKKSNCPISDDCSLHGCYRYFCCDFPDKIVEN